MKQAPESLARRVLTSVRRYLFEDAKLKLLALLIVTVIWFSVAGQTRTGAPIKIHGLDVALDKVPPGLAVTTTDPGQVAITVEGPEDQLRELRFETATQSSDLAVYADLSNLKEGVQFAPLLVRGLPDGVVLRKVEPADAVRVTLDPIGTREVPVEPRFAGELPQGYKLTAAYTDPGTVTISGPETVISKIEKVTTTTVSLNNRTGSFAEKVDVDVAGDGIEVQAQPVLHVTIEEDFGSKAFTIPIEIESGAGGEADPQSLTVTLKGPIPLLAAFKPSDIKATIVPSGPSPRQSLAPQIDLLGPNAPRVEVERISPVVVRWRK